MVAMLPAMTSDARNVYIEAHSPRHSGSIFAAELLHLNQIISQVHHVQKSISRCLENDDCRWLNKLIEENPTVAETTKENYKVVIA